ncbi:MAG: hypothetical protein BWY04_00919 [candidate division CPR1 bacterium ADurb.Bin160]|uniref:Uncharacterized protein n=1 Tax=candidate division CPR1 bacterium ADurb.Bin160 TaxID=1852826 RepID=A0A1V5ZMM6_9BACT|nr:MAG: hypothetical protein BWY04_00919 [candidate division CPR1 bacterium ADurb.Bin160]
MSLALVFSSFMISTFANNFSNSAIFELIKSLSSIADLYSKFSERSQSAFASDNLSCTAGSSTCL